MRPHPRPGPGRARVGRPTSEREIARERRTRVLLTEDLGPVRRLTLNRPASLNALNGALMEALDAAFDAAAEDDDVRVVILRGAGRAFCAGYDLNQDAEEGTKDAARVAPGAGPRHTTGCSGSSSSPSP